MIADNQMEDKEIALKNEHVHILSRITRCSLVNIALTNGPQASICATIIFYLCWRPEGDQILLNIQI